MASTRYINSDIQLVLLRIKCRSMPRNYQIVLGNFKQYLCLRSFSKHFAIAKHCSPSSKVHNVRGMFFQFHFSVFEMCATVMSECK